MEGYHSTRTEVVRRVLRPRGDVGEDEDAVSKVVGSTFRAELVVQGITVDRGNLEIWNIEIESNSDLEPLLRSLMSDSPVIFKRSKTKPGQRARQKSPDANDATSDFTSQGDESPITLASKLKNKAKRAKPKSKLSFGGDDDEVCVITVLRELILMGDGAMEGGGEVFQVKKSNLSQKLKLGTHPASPAYVFYMFLEVNSTH
jgi:hypothetical protein